MKKLKIGVAGTGYLGTFHARNYAGFDTIELCGIYDNNPEKAAEIATELAISAFPTLDDMLEAVDAISIVVPTKAHYATAKAALQKKVHVLLEKPFTETLVQADELIALAAANNTVLQVGHIERFNPAFTCLAKKYIKPLFIEAHRMAPFNPRGTDVAVILDLMIHDIDLILTMVKSPVTDIHAVGVPVLSHHADIANVRLRFANGTVANITASRISLAPMRKMRIFQEDTYLSLDFIKGETELFHLAEPTASADGGIIVAELTGGEKSGKIIRTFYPRNDTNPLATEQRAFIDAITNKTPPIVSGTHGREALQVAQTIIEQIRKTTLVE